MRRWQLWRAFVAAAAVAWMALAAVAMACTPQAYLQSPDGRAPGDLGRYAPGSEVPVTGVEFLPDAEIALSWRGEVVKRVRVNSNGSFRTTVAIPQGTPYGDYTLVARGRKPNGDYIEGLPTSAYIAVVPPANGAGGGKAQAGLPERSEPPAAESLQAAGGDDGLSWVFLALGGLGLLLVGGAAGALVIARRRSRAPSTGARGPEADQLEAELQQILAEERSKHIGSQRR